MRSEEAIFAGLANAPCTSIVTDEPTSDDNSHWKLADADDKPGLCLVIMSCAVELRPGDRSTAAGIGADKVSVDARTSHSAVTLSATAPPRSFAAIIAVADTLGSALTSHHLALAATMPDDRGRHLQPCWAITGIGQTAAL